MTRKALLLFGILAAMFSAGCYREADDVALHQPGQYTGKADSAAILRPSDDARAALKERFRLTQTDR